MRQGDVVLIWYSSKSKSGEYRLGRVVVVEVDDDELVRTCIVRYSLVQHIYGKERDKYTGVTAKYIRLAIQRLVLILPVEEQQSIPEISEEEVEKAKEACGVLEEKTDTPAIVVEVHTDGHSVRVQSNMVVSMLRQKGEFDQAMMKCFKKEEDDTFQAAFYINYISQERSQEQEFCGLCSQCREEKLEERKRFE